MLHAILANRHPTYLMNLAGDAGYIARKYPVVNGTSGRTNHFAVEDINSGATFARNLGTMVVKIEIQNGRIDWRTYGE